MIKHSPKIDPFLWPQNLPWQHTINRGWVKNWLDWKKAVCAPYCATNVFCIAFVQEFTLQKRQWLPYLTQVNRTSLICRCVLFFNVFFFFHTIHKAFGVDRNQNQYLWNANIPSSEDVIQKNHRLYLHCYVDIADTNQSFNLSLFKIFVNQLHSI